MWSLSHVSIVNYKSIHELSFSVQAKSSLSIQGSNGAGKSNIIEAIAFGLAAPLSALRCQTLADLCGAHSPAGTQVAVQLKFTEGKKGKKLTVGSSAINNGSQRIYTVDAKTVTKHSFIQTLTDTLGFSTTDSFSWFLSQRAVDAVVTASATKLFETLTFLAKTDVLLNAQKDAERQLLKFEKVFLAVSASVASLEQEVEARKQKLASITDEVAIAGQIAAAEATEAQAEAAHAAAVRHAELTRARGLLAACEALRGRERALAAALAPRASTSAAAAAAAAEDGEEALAEACQRTRAQLAREEAQWRQALDACADHDEQHGRLEAALRERRARSDAEENTRVELVSALIPQLVARITALTEIAGVPGADSFFSGAAVLAAKQKQLCQVRPFRHARSWK